jgi:hypothetical protein
VKKVCDTLNKKHPLYPEAAATIGRIVRHPIPPDMNTFVRWSMCTKKGHKAGSVFEAHKMARATPNSGHIRSEGRKADLLVNDVHSFHEYYKHIDSNAMVFDVQPLLTPETKGVLEELIECMNKG